MSTAQQIAELKTRLADTEAKVARLLAIAPAQLEESLNAAAAAKFLSMGLKNFNRLVRLKIIRPVPGKKRQRQYLTSTLITYRATRLT